MSLVTAQKPVKMSFSIDELAKSSRVTSVNQNKNVGGIYAKFQNIVSFQHENTPVKLQATVQPMTSTPISLPLANPSVERQFKRKREDDSIFSADSSLESSETKSTDSLSSISDDTTEIQDKPSKKASAKNRLDDFEGEEEEAEDVVSEVLQGRKDKAKEASEARAKTADEKRVEQLKLREERKKAYEERRKKLLEEREAKKKEKEEERVKDTEEAKDGNI